MAAGKPDTTVNEAAFQQLSDAEPSIVEQAVASGGAYEIIRKRLEEQGRELHTKTNALNEARVVEVGSTELESIARVRVRTENNCVARDIVQVGENLLFGYTVFIGLKKETRVEDVFALFSLNENNGEYSIDAANDEARFLNDKRFRSDFRELHEYYKHARLVQLRNVNGKLLAGFQFGGKLEDIRVFRWSVSADGKKVEYIDNRGERDILLPPAYDFEWQESSRDNIVNGRHPHINVCDTLFIDNLSANLCFKIENNTETGLGIYSEELENANQSLDDLELFYAQIGSLLLVRVLPYKELAWRHFVFDPGTQSIVRIDAIGDSCVQLPEDHGIIFPGGYYLQNGEHKTYANESIGFKYKRTIRSPNGEDVLFVFYEPEQGSFLLFPYNLINRTLQNPIHGHGYALAEDGRLTNFVSDNDPTRVHPMQIWRTPFTSQEFADLTPKSQSFFGRIGNTALVRGVSDLFNITQQIREKIVSLTHYEKLQSNVARAFDSHYWMDSQETGGVDEILKEVAATCELIIDEFEKVDAIRRQSSAAILDAEQRHQQLISSIHNASYKEVADFVELIDKVRHLRGHLATISDYRYIDTERITTLDQELQEHTEQLGHSTMEFLADEKSLKPYLSQIEKLDQQIENVKTVAQLSPILESANDIASSLDLLSELVTTLHVDDTTVRTRIVDAISSIYSSLNQTRATAKHTQSELGSEESIAQFSAQFRLLSQSVNNALGLASDPERCDEQLARLLVQLEELESQFGEHEQFLGDIVEKREEIYDTFDSHKQRLIEAQQKRVQALQRSAQRMLQSIEKRSQKLVDADELNTYLVSDPLVLKVSELNEQLTSLGGNLQADDIEAKFKMIKDQALRSLRDKSDIFESGGKVIKLGNRHKFSVNTEELELSIIPDEDNLAVHLNGTQYFEKIDSQELNALREYWSLSLESESPTVYRGEYLAYQFLEHWERQAASATALKETKTSEEELYPLIQKFAAPRYKEGYEKGVHDHDAAKIAAALLPMLKKAGGLIFTPKQRALSLVFWQHLSQTTGGKQQTDRWSQRAESAHTLKQALGSTRDLELFVTELRDSLLAFNLQFEFNYDESFVLGSAEYLAGQLSDGKIKFTQSRYATTLLDLYQSKLTKKARLGHSIALSALRNQPLQQIALAKVWFEALLDDSENKHNAELLRHFIPETSALLICSDPETSSENDLNLELKINNLLGDHELIHERGLSFTLDQYIHRMQQHERVVLPSFQHFLKIKHSIAQREREILALDSFKPKPLSSFVRNKLIDQAYLPIIGDNLAKQIGTLGESKRTDLMGLLMMISPPGYGKTTLMEYVASRLGLIFLKINCPALGHDVVSLDAAQAPNATAKKELEKLNLGLEMGNNVMLYLDDIQHTNPEFLQKFISLCDATRRIEGVWRGKVKTYDLRGKRFCVVMAGNPYTESGESFTVPDMLANRADIYNLGDILGGMDEQFALSYIENSLTSNSILAPLAVREMSDVYKFVDMAKGIDVATTDLSHSYSGAEVSEIVGVLKKMFVVQDLILKVNQQYIASAAQEDKYRIEPPFLLQGSYRNMNKISEKVSAVMNDKELAQVLDDHYLGESQLLTSGSEANLLKLGELRNALSKEQEVRWKQIKQDFLREKAIGGDSANAGNRISAQLADLVTSVNALNTAEHEERNKKAIDALGKSVQQLLANPIEISPTIEVVNTLPPELGKTLSFLGATIENTLFPVLRSMDKKMDIDLRTQEKMQAISDQLRSLQKMIDQSKKQDDF